MPETIPVKCTSTSIHHSIIHKVPIQLLFGNPGKWNLNKSLKSEESAFELSWPGKVIWGDSHCLSNSFLSPARNTRGKWFQSRFKPIHCDPLTNNPQNDRESGRYVQAQGFQQEWKFNSSFVQNLLPPMSVVEVIKTEVSACVSVCVSVWEHSHSWTNWRKVAQFGTGIGLDEICSRAQIGLARGRCSNT